MESTLDLTLYAEKSALMERYLSTPLGLSPAASSAAVSKSMRGNRRRDTSPELTLRRLLRAAGMGGYRIAWKKAPGRPDIAYPGKRIAIFVNGCFWHRCPHCNPSVPKSNADFWQHKFARNQERDARKVRELEEAGWTVLTVWECELRAPLVEAVANIRRLLGA
jgi:DNA mismatch endonuclease Vsr